jgi:GR25 family glycosyltransferase involved in LPS biosynthesis|tara:strand:- start:735 stop:1562 length:828 start_codon:yes stop_codon:yes gene_type:complete
MYLGADSVYAINVVRNKLRLNHIKALSAELDLDINIIEAIDNQSVIPLSKEFYKENLGEWFFDPAGWFSVGIVCCALSHRKAWKAFIESGDEVGLFLEDDAMPTFDVHSYDFNAVRHELNTLDWGVCWYGKWQPDIPHLGSKLSPNIYQSGEHNRYNYAAHSYLLNRKSAQWFYKNSLPVYYAADVRLEISPFKQVTLNKSIFLQKRQEVAISNNPIDAEWYNGTMEDCGDSYVMVKGVRSYGLDTTSEYLNIKKSQRHNKVIKGVQIEGIQFDL